MVIPFGTAATVAMGRWELGTTPAPAAVISSVTNALWNTSKSVIDISIQLSTSSCVRSSLAHDSCGFMVLLAWWDCDYLVKKGVFWQAKPPSTISSLLPGCLGRVRLQAKPGSRAMPLLSHDCCPASTIDGYFLSSQGIVLFFRLDAFCLVCLNGQRSLCILASEHWSAQSNSV